MLGLEPFDCLLVLVAFVRMHGVQRRTHPLQTLLEHIFAAAGGGLASAFLHVAGAVIVDVLLLLNLADHRAAAARAGDNPVAAG